MKIKKKNFQYQLKKMTKTNLTPQEWKEKGNEEFKDGLYEKALVSYTNALKLVNEDNFDRAVYLKNRAAVYLKQKEFNKAIKDCDDSLKIFPNDPKALFRRCQALEAIERYEEAYRDARAVVLIEPNNKVIQQTVARLHEITQERLRQSSNTSNKVSVVFLNNVTLQILII